MALQNPRQSTNMKGIHELTSTCTATVLAVCLWLLCMQQQLSMSGAEPLSEYLWKQTEAIRYRTLSTSFVQELANGSLNQTAFGKIFQQTVGIPMATNCSPLLAYEAEFVQLGGKIFQQTVGIPMATNCSPLLAYEAELVEKLVRTGSYMVQDAVYCYMAKESIDMSVSRAPDGKLKDHLRKESTDYERYYQLLFAKWHISDPVGINMSNACQSYADYEYQIASTKDTIYMIVAMIPCMKLWPLLGQQLSSYDHGVYTEWFNLYFDPQYERYKALDVFVDEAEVSKTINRTEALQVFTRWMVGEFEFFSSIQPMTSTVDDNVTSGSVSCTGWTPNISMYIAASIMFYYRLYF